MKVIGILGYAGSGKDTTAMEIKKAFRGKTTILHFATALKKQARLFGWDGKKDKKGRWFLQFLGTDIARAYKDSYWTDIIEHKIIKSKSNLIIIPDVRFPNECELIKKYGGVLLVVERPEAFNLWVWVKSLFKKRHRSEQYKKWINHFDHYTLQNDDDITKIQGKLENIEYFKKLFDFKSKM